MEEKETMNTVEDTEEDFDAAEGAEEYAEETEEGDEDGLALEEDDALDLGDAEEIPADEEEEEEDPSDGEEEDPSEGSEPDPKEETPAPSPEKGEPDFGAEALAAEKRKREELEKHVKKLLKNYGESGEDVLSEVIKLSADSEGLTPEEYLRKHATEEAEELALRQAKEQSNEAVFAADLAILHASYPESKAWDHVKKMPKEIFDKFATYRSLGLPAKDAYAAANPDGIRTSVAASVKKQDLHHTKAHLRSSVPKGSRDNSVTLSRRELERYREEFPGKSDKELQSLYRRATK